MIDKANIIKTYRKSANDTGSSAVQIAILTAKINHLAQHLREHKKDKHTTYGLTCAVSKRKSLMAYYKKQDAEGYQKLIQSLGLRK